MSRRHALAARPPREQAWRQVHKVEALQAQGGACEWCWRPITRRQATAEHRLATSRGGRTRADNIDAACLDCNKAKGSLTVGQFRRAIKRPDLQRDGWRLYLACVEIRLRRATERACRRLAKIIAVPT